MDFAISLPHELDAEIARAPIAYIPWGAHEWHGVHNLVGVDGIKAEFLARELCAETGGVVLPTVYCGHSTVGTLGFRHSLEFDPETVAAYARNYVDLLAHDGFRVIVMILGHWGHHHGDTLRRVVAEFNARQSAARAWAVQENEMLHEPGHPDDHGGPEETSFIMAYLPGKVDLDRLPDREITFEGDGILGGDPRAGASAERGRALVRAYAQEAAKRVRAMLEETHA